MKTIPILLALAVAAPAMAQDADDDFATSRRELPSGLGATVTAGGGVTDFTDDTFGDRTEVGGSWNIRASYGTRSIIGGEAAYVGSARGLEANDNALISNGAEVALRVNGPIPFDGDRGLVEPFAVAGIGGQVYDETDTEGEGLADNELVGVIPLGVGIGGSYDGVYLDTRVMWRPSFDENGGIGEDNDLSTVEWTANIGGEF